MGNYLEIVSVNAPSEALVGETVNVNIFAYNKTPNRIFAIVTADCNGTGFATSSHWVEPGAQRAFGFSFVMPKGDVTIWCWVWRWDFNTGAWSTAPEDAYGPVVVRLGGEAPPPTISGAIESVRVKGEGTAWTTAPLTVGAGKKVSIRFDAHSGYGSYPFGLWFDASVILKKPISGDQERYDKSETGPYSKCTLDHFDFEEDWVADEKGTYYATVILRARSSLYGSSVEVDRKTNVKVFTVTQDVPSPDEYLGEISKVQGRTGVANWGGIPLSLKQGDGYSIAVIVTNKSSIALVLRGTLTITKPSGNKDTASDFTGTSVPYIETTVSPGASHTFKWNPYPQVHAFTADEVGDYQASFALQGKKSGEPDSAYRALCDPWQGTVATVSSPHGEPSGKAEIVRKALDFELLGSGYEIPVTKTLSVPEHARLSIIAKTISAERERLKAEVWIYGPAPVLGQQEGGEITHGPLKYHYTDTSSWPCCDPETQHEFIWPSSLIPLPNSTFLINEEGQWTITINITDASDGELLATYDGVMCGAEKAAPSIWGIFAEIMPLMMIMMMFGMMIPMTRELGQGVEE